MFADVKQEIQGAGNMYRVPGANFDEVVFADDTICITQDSKITNRMLKAIEVIGKKSGMRLNRGKCEAIKYGGTAKIMFLDKQLVKTVTKSKYLGCILNKENNPIVEVRGRIREAMGVLKRMHAFWRHSNCTIKFNWNQQNCKQLPSKRWMYSI